MSEDRGAERAGQKTNAVGAERSDSAESGIGQWKKQLVEDERARGTVNQEIVPLDRRTEDARDNDALDLLVCSSGLSASGTRPTMLRTCPQ